MTSENRGPVVKSSVKLFREQKALDLRSFPFSGCLPSSEKVLGFPSWHIFYTVYVGLSILEESAAILAP